LVVNASPHGSTTQDGPWILHPAEVRLSMNLRMLRCIKAEDGMAGMREATCSHSALGHW